MDVTNLSHEHKTPKSVFILMSLMMTWKRFEALQMIWASLSSEFFSGKHKKIKSYLHINKHFPVNFGLWTVGLATMVVPLLVVGLALWLIPLSSTHKTEVWLHIKPSTQAFSHQVLFSWLKNIFRQWNLHIKYSIFVCRYKTSHGASLQRDLLAIKFTQV